MNYEKAVKNIREDLKKYIEKNEIQSLVIGISGGIDSALCAALARPVCDNLGIKLHGRSITIGNSIDEVDRATLVGEAFCHTFDDVYALTAALSDVWSVCAPEGWDLEDENKKIRLGNIKARLRMIYLYDLAQIHKGMVLSTDNLTELFLGFWTLHGDVGDFGMIQSLWKTEVYEMSEWLIKNEFQFNNQKEAIQVCIDCQATDGLGISKTDLEQIMPSWEGSSRDGYKIVDERLKLFIEKGEGDLDDKVIHRHLRTEFKRNNPYNTPRETITDGI